MPFQKGSSGAIPISKLLCGKPGQTQKLLRNLVRSSLGSLRTNHAGLLLIGWKSKIKLGFIFGASGVAIDTFEHIFGKFIPEGWRHMGVALRYLVSDLFHVEVASLVSKRNLRFKGYSIINTYS